MRAPSSGVSAGIVLRSPVARGAARRETRSPAAGSRARASCPGICASGAPRCAAARHRADQAARVGMAAARSSTSSTRPVSTMRPAYITAMRSARPATTARSCVIQISAVPVSAAELLHLGQDLRLDGDVERGGRLVGDDQRRAGAAARSRSRRAGACRPRTGADRRRAARRATAMPTRASASRARPRAAASRHALVREDRLDHLRVDAQHRVQRHHRVLEDHRDAVAAQARSASSGAADQLVAVEAR